MAASDVSQWVDRIYSSVEAVRNAHFSLVWLAGGISAERSLLLSGVAERLKCPHLRVGRQLSAALLDLSPRLRAVSAEDSVQDLLLATEADMICLDHLDILFDPSLRLNAVDMIQNASRRFVLVASWPGTIHRKSLSFGPEDHPAHLRISLQQLSSPVITLP